MPVIRTKSRSPVVSIVVKPKPTGLSKPEVPAAGQPVSQWRGSSKYDFTGWVLGEKIKAFDDLKPGSMYLADSAYLDSLSLVQVEAFRPHNQVVAPEYEKAIHLKPLDPQDIQSGPIAYLEYAFFEMYFGGGGFGQDFYQIHRAVGQAV